MEESDQQQTQVDIYNAALTQKGLVELGGAVRSNYLHDSETFAWTEAEAAIFAAIENGSTQVLVDQAGRNQILDYYSRHQLEEIDRWNMSMIGLRNINDTVVMEAD